MLTIFEYCNPWQFKHEVQCMYLGLNMTKFDKILLKVTSALKIEQTATETISCLERKKKQKKKKMKNQILPLCTECPRVNKIKTNCIDFKF